MGGKEAAARLAAGLVMEGMTIGIGTGSTAAYAIQALGERVQREGLKIRGVPTSVGSRRMAEQYQIPLVDLSDPGVAELDLTIDGADEVSPDFHLIKGGGGALLREKIVASASREMIVICDEGKLKPVLGAHPLPIAVIPFGFEATHRRLLRFTDHAVLRAGQDGKPFVTDDGLLIYDLHLERIADPPALELELRRIVGVVEVGLFIGLAGRVVVGYEDGDTTVLTTPDLTV